MWSPQTTAFYHSRPTSPKFGEKSQLPSKKSNSDHMTKKGFVRLNSMESMSSTTSTASTNSNSNYPSVGVKSDLGKTLDPKIRTPMTAKESKWFGKYQNDYQYHQYQPQYWNNQHLNPHQKWNTNQPSQHNQYFGQIEQQNPQSHYWPQQYQYQVPQHPNHQDSHYWPPQYQYQVPYNLTKGQFEVWQMEAMATGIDQMSYSSQHIVYQDPQQGHYCPEHESGFSKCVNSFFQWGSALVATAATAVSTLKESTTSLTSTLNPDLGSSGRVDPGDHPGVGYPEVHPVSTTTSLASSLNPNAQEFTPAKPPAESPSGALAGSTGSVAGSTGSAHGVGVYPEVPVVKSGELINAKDIHSAEKSIKIVPDELQNHDNSEISTNCNNKTSPLEKQIITVNDSEPVTPPNGPETIELKAVNQRKCTPWVHKGGSIPKVSGAKDDTIEEDDILEEEEDFDDNNSDDGSDFEADSVTCNSPRLRLLSICSSEDGIHFEGSSPNASLNLSQLSAASPKYKIDQTKCSPFLKSFLAGPDDLSEEDSEDDDIDDNDDWDKISDDNQIGFEIDLELEFGFPSIPNLHTIQAIKKNSKIDDEVDHNQLTSMKNQQHQINIDKKKTAACCEGDKFPTDLVDVNYAGQVLMKIKEANEKWDFLDSDSQKTSNPDSQNSKKVRNVAFSEPLVSGIKLEDPEMADELRVARVGEYNFVQRSADQDRYNRLLGPVFQPEHRDKIRSYIAELNSRVI